MKSTARLISPRWIATVRAGFRSQPPRKKWLTGALLLLGLMRASAHGADLDLFSDAFDSSTGPLLGMNPGLGGPWSQTGTNSTNPIGLIGGAVTLNGVGQDAYASLASSVANRAGTDLKTSLDLNVLAAQPAGDYFLHLSNPLGTTFNFYQRLFARSSENGYQLGLLDTAGSGSITTWGTQELSFGASHHVDIVWHFTPSGTRNDTLSLSLDGTPYLTHTWTSTIDEPSELAAVNLRQGNATTTVPWVTLDNLRITAVTAPPAPYNIFQWEYINPANPSQGKQQSTVLAPDGYGLHAETGLNAVGSNLTKGFLIGANLTNAAFRSANLTDASLSQANLTNANFDGANLSGADLTGALIQGAQFYGLQDGSLAQLYSTASYQAHDLSGIGLGGNGLAGANFAGQNLSTATFQNATLTRANFKQANLTGANLTGANLTGATIVAALFTDAVVTNAKLSSTHITLDQLYSTASYRDHNLAGVQFIGNDLSGADFSHQALGSASFYAAKLVGADLTNADLTNAELVNADLSGANLTGANFTYGTLALANLSGANLRNANFSGTNMIGANFSGADIRGASLSKVISYGGGSDGRPCGCGLVPWWPTPQPTPTYQIIGSGITLSQLVSTASYAARDLAGTTFMNNNFNGGNFAGFNLTNTNFYGTTLVGADFTGVDARGAFNLNAPSAANFIRPDGHIASLNLSVGQSLSIRVYDAPPATAPIPIKVDQFTMAPGGTLRLIFEADAWNSTISFAAGIPVLLSGNLQLELAAGVDPLSQIGRTFDLFDWTGVSRTGTFAVNSPYLWDLSNLYSTGDVTFLGNAGQGGIAESSLAVPEPTAWLLLSMGLAAVWTFDRRRSNRALIALLAQLVLPASFTLAATPDIQLTMIGNPIWKPVDFLLFSAPATPFAQTAAQIFDTILPNDDFNAYVPHLPPYDTELSSGALAGGYVTKSLFAPDAIALNPNGIYYMYMLVPQPGVTGDSRDFESGPVIPNSLFPILNNLDVWLDGVLVDRAPGADAVINVEQLDVGNVGISHLEVMQAVWHPWDDDLTAGPLGRYNLRTSIRDASGSGWDAVVPFRVALPGDYDYSGTVGPEDYGIWKANFGSTTNFDADGNDNHVVDAADYTIWRDHFSTAGAGQLSLVAAIPEPASVALVVAVAFCASFVRLRQRPLRAKAF